MNDFYLSNHVCDIICGVVAGKWFYVLDLIGTTAFAISGVIKAHKLRSDMLIVKTFDPLSEDKK